MGFKEREGAVTQLSGGVLEHGKGRQCGAAVCGGGGGSFSESLHSQELRQADRDKDGGVHPVSWLSQSM